MFCPTGPIGSPDQPNPVALYQPGAVIAVVSSCDGTIAWDDSGADRRGHGQDEQYPPGPPLRLRPAEVKQCAYDCQGQGDQRHTCAPSIIEGCCDRKRQEYRQSRTRPAQCNERRKKQKKRRPEVLDKRKAQS